MKKDITIELLSETKVNQKAVRRWLDKLGVSPEYTLPDDIADPALIVALAGKRCYNSFEVGLNPNVTKIRADWCEYLDNILASGHGSVLEHACYTFGFENVTRVFTAENNRHRAGCAISEASMRYIRFEEAIPYWEPLSIRGPDVLEKQDAKFFDTGNLSDILSQLEEDDLPEEECKHINRLMFARAFEHQEIIYKIMCALWKKKLHPDSKFAGKKAITSMMRRIVGLGCCTGEVWTGNIRAIRHVLTMRAAPEAEEEIAHVYTRVAKIMIECNPFLFGDFVQDSNGFFKPKYRKV